MAHANTPLFSRATRWVAALGLVAAATVATAPAHAHDELLTTNPAADSALAEAPGELELTYSGELMEVTGANQVRVTNAAGQSVTEGEPEVDGKTVTQELTTGGSADDTYTVTWRVVSSDGHPIQGTFTYTVGEGASAVTATDSSASSAPADPLTEASSGLSTLAKVSIFAAAAAAILGGIFIVLAKTKKRG